MLVIVIVILGVQATKLISHPLLRTLLAGSVSMPFSSWDTSSKASKVLSESRSEVRSAIGTLD